MSSDIPSLEEQATIYTHIESTTKLEPDRYAYLISKEWLNSFKFSVGLLGNQLSDTPVDPINNHSFYDGNKIFEAKEDIDYQIITEELWEALYSWYSGGPIVRYKCILYNGIVRVDLPNVPVKLKYNNDERSIHISKYWTFGLIFEKAKKMFHMPPDIILDICLYDDDGIYLKRLNESDSMATDPTFAPGAQISFEKPYRSSTSDSPLPPDNEDDTFDNLFDNTSDPEPETPANNYMSMNRPTMLSHSYMSSYRPSFYDGPKGPGKVGFNNLGNTCFFNSGVQCLVHQSPLVRIFLHTNWRRDINYENRLGSRGVLVEAFGSLLHKVWHPTESRISPSRLKQAIGEFATQFSGWGQQDSHELITFMLDGIHEDLNRCRQKPQVDTVLGDGTDDDKTATEAWKNHKKRNDSIIVDIFHGQLRSQCNCPKCHSTTVVFDPYVALSLPIKIVQTIKAKFIPFDFRKPYQTLELPLTPSIEEIAAEKMNVGKVKLGYTSRYSRSSIKWRIPEETFDAEFYLFEIPENIKFFIPAFVKADVRNYPSDYFSTESEIAGPFLIPTNGPDVSIDDLERIVGEVLPVFDNNDEEIEITEEMKRHSELITFRSAEDEPHFRVQLSRYAYGNPLRPDDTFEQFCAYAVSVSINVDNSFNVFSLIRHYVSDVYEDSSEEEDISLDQCFKNFSKEETLDEKNQWYCPHCKEFVCATKKMDVWSTPNTMIIQLKRFVTLITGTRKLDNNVIFPDVLDMSKYVVGPQKGQELKYRLTAVSEHMGGLGGGHYTAHALVVPDGSKPGTADWDGEWYSFNDSSCESSSALSAHSSSAYVLFYEKIPNSDDKEDPLMKELDTEEEDSLAEDEDSMREEEDSPTENHSEDEEEHSRNYDEDAIKDHPTENQHNCE